MGLQEEGSFLLELGFKCEMTKASFKFGGIWPNFMLKFHNLASGADKGLAHLFNRIGNSISLRFVIM